MTKLEAYNWAKAVSDSKMTNSDKAKNIAGIISQLEFSRQHGLPARKRVECEVLN